MSQLPPVPAWDGLHPLIIHFPIVLLLIAPLFIVIAAALGPVKGRSHVITALILMIIGTASVFVAVSTGEEAGKLAERTPAINAILENHEDLAETTRLWFSSLTLLLAGGIVALSLVKRLQSRAVVTAGTVAFLLVYTFGALTLVNTAHNGGRLVHEFGVHALVAPAPGTPPATAPPPEREGE